MSINSSFFLFQFLRSILFRIFFVKFICQLLLLGKERISTILELNHSTFHNSLSLFLSLSIYVSLSLHLSNYFSLSLSFIFLSVSPSLSVSLSLCVRVSLSLSLSHTLYLSPFSSSSLFLVCHIKVSIRRMDDEALNQRKEYDQVINERDILGTQLIRRNDELALLYEKVRAL